MGLKSAPRRTLTLSVLISALLILYFAAAIWADGQEGLPREGIGVGSRRAMVKIGILKFSSTPVFSDFLKGITRALGDVGYKEGLNCLITIGEAEGNSQKAEKIIRDFVQERMNVIVTTYSQAFRAGVKEAGKVPVVFCIPQQPSPEDKEDLLRYENCTGVFAPAPMDDLLQEARRLFPEARVAGCLYHAQNQDSQQEFNRLRQTCKKFGVKLLGQPIDSGQEIEDGARNLLSQKAEFFIQINDDLVNNGLEALVDIVSIRGKPLFIFSPGQVVQGAALGLGCDYFMAGYRTGLMVSRILMGEESSFIPFEVFGKKLLCINLEAARLQKVSLPEALLRRADRIYLRIQKSFSSAAMDKSVPLDSKGLAEFTFYTEGKAGPEDVGLLLAKEQGIFSRYGLQVEIKEARQDSSASSDASYTGAYAIEMNNPWEIALPVKPGRYLMVSATFQRPSLCLVSWNPLTQAGGMKGQRISVYPGYVQSLVPFLGQDYEKAGQVSFQDPPDAFLNQKVGISQARTYRELLRYESAALTRRRQGEPNCRFYTYRYSDLNANLGWQEGCIAVPAQLIEDQPDIVARFLQGLYEGWTWFLEHDLDSSVAVLRKYIPEIDSAWAKAGLKEISRLLTSQDTERYGLGLISPTVWDGFRQAMMESGLKVPRDEFYTLRFLPQVFPRPQTLHCGLVSIAKDTALTTQTRLKEMVRSFGQQMEASSAFLPISDAQEIEKLISKGCQLLFCQSSGLEGSVLGLLDKFPWVDFVVRDSRESSFNLFSYRVNREEVCYLAGVLAQGASKSGGIGWIECGPQGSARLFRAFVLGARGRKPQVKVLELIVGDKETQDKEQIASFLKQGVDVVFVCGHLPFEALQALKDGGAWLIVEEGEVGGRVLANIVYRWDKAFSNIYRILQEGEFLRTYELSISNGGISFEVAAPESLSTEASRDFYNSYREVLERRLDLESLLKQEKGEPNG